ncbi:MAG: hypothetical protein WBD25_19300 [Terriglobales bacterium]
MSTVANDSPSECGAASNEDNNLFSFNMLQSIFKMCADFEQAEAKSGQLFPPGGTTLVKLSTKLIVPRREIPHS